MDQSCLELSDGKFRMSFIGEIDQVSQRRLYEQFRQMIEHGELGPYMALMGLELHDVTMTRSPRGDRMIELRVKRRGEQSWRGNELRLRVRHDYHAHNDTYELVLEPNWREYLANFAYRKPDETED